MTKKSKDSQEEILNKIDSLQKQSSYKDVMFHSSPLLWNIYKLLDSIYFYHTVIVLCILLSIFAIQMKQYRVLALFTFIIVLSIQKIVKKRKK